MIKVFCDGGARGNPGPAAVGVVGYDNDNKIFEISKRIGETTNNVAEYTAVIAALTKLTEVKLLNRIHFSLDSELVVKQLNGEYRVKDIKLKQLYANVMCLLSKFTDVTFEHTRRKNNSYADKLVNDALDGQ